jgi:outer membrane protein W
MFFRKFIVLVFAFACAASCALAQGSDTTLSKIEVTPFGGAKFGGKINVYGYDSNPTYGSEVENMLVKSNYDYGVIADYNIWSSFAIEFMLDRQPTTYTEQILSVPTTSGMGINGTLSTYTFGGAYTFRSDAKVRPFVAGGLGWTNFGGLDSDPGELYVGFNNKLAFNLGGGVKYNLNNFLGLRFDMRWFGSRTTPTVSTECSVYYGCGEYSSNYRMNQGAANVGLIIRF